MEKSEKKRTRGIRIYDPHSLILEREFGSVQKAVDFLCEIVSKYGDKFQVIKEMEWINSRVKKIRKK